MIPEAPCVERALARHGVDLGWGAVSNLSQISDLSQKFKHDLWRVKSELKLSQKQHLTPGVPEKSGFSTRKAKC